jgi:hypothetical protein
MNPKYTTHEPKKLPVYPVELKAPAPNRAKKRVKRFDPLLSNEEKKSIKTMTQHQRVINLRIIRMGITPKEYLQRCVFKS